MKKIVNSLILIVYLLFSIFLIYLLNDILTTKELLIIVIFLIVLEMLFIYLLKNNILLLFSYPCILFVLICLFIFNFKSNELISFAHYINENVNDYYLVSLKERSLQLEDLNNQKIGILNKSSIFYDVEIEYTEVCYDNLNSMIKDLKDQKITAVIISSEEYLLLEDNLYEIIYKEEKKVIPTFENNSNTKLIYITSEAMSNKYINIILGINDTTKQMVIINIPQDYYIYLKDKKESDILSSINNYSMVKSIEVIEDLIQNKIDYYLKVNFENLKDLIDDIGGIEIESNHEFVSFGVEIKKGINHLNGEETLAFIDYANRLIGGSRIQDENQNKVLEAIVEKLIRDNKFLEVFDELKNVIKTNIPEDEILKLIKNQIKHKDKWNIIKYSLDGTDQYNYTYSSKCCKLNVIVPDETTINNAITMFEYLKSDSFFN